MKSKNNYTEFKNIFYLIIVFVLIYSCNTNNKIEEFFSKENQIEKKIYHLNDYDSVVTFYATNNLKEIYFVKGGLKDGKYVQYYNDKKPIVGTEANYIEGIRNGKYMNYHKDGKIAWDLTYENGFLIKQVVFDNTDTMALIINKSKIIHYKNNIPDTTTINN